MSDEEDDPLFSCALPTIQPVAPDDGEQLTDDDDDDPLFSAVEVEDILNLVQRSTHRAPTESSSCSTSRPSASTTGGDTKSTVSEGVAFETDVHGSEQVCVKSCSMQMLDTSHASTSTAVCTFTLGDCV